VQSRDLLQVAEIWVPDESGHRLILQSGCYGQAKEFRSVSEAMEFRKGVGLPGRVWEAGRPIVLNHFRGSGFLRADAAARAGLVAGLGFPVYRGGSCVAVCLLLFGGSEPQSSVFEVWAPEAASGELALVSGYHGQLDAFRRLSALMKIPPGVGLPGRVWEGRAPILLDRLDDSGAFFRAAAAETYGLSMGLGLPVFSEGTLSSILLMLAGRGSPLARAIEVWVPNPSGDALVLKSSVYQTSTAPVPDRSYRKGEGLAGAVWASLMPKVVDTNAYPSSESARDGIERGIGIPVVDGQRFTAAVLLLN
jgi:GAF domain